MARKIEWSLPLLTVDNWGHQPPRITPDCSGITQTPLTEMTLMGKQYKQPKHTLQKALTHLKFILWCHNLVSLHL